MVAENYAYCIFFVVCLFKQTFRRLIKNVSTTRGGSVVASDWSWYTEYYLFYFSMRASGSTAVLNVLNKGK